MIFKAVLVASQMWPPCPYKPLSFQTLRYPQFLSNFHWPKFKFSVSGDKHVRLFDVMTKTSVLSNKNVPLAIDGARQHIIPHITTFYIKLHPIPPGDPGMMEILKCIHPRGHRNHSKISFYKSYGDLCLLAKCITYSYTFII